MLVFRGLTWLVAALVAIQALLWIPTLHNEAIINDKWADVANLAESSSWTHHLFSRHNEHFIPTTRALTLLDYRFFLGRYWSVTLASAFVWLAGSALAMQQLRRYPNWWALPLMLIWLVNGFGAANSGFAYFFQHHAIWCLLALTTFVAGWDANGKRWWIQIPIIILALGSNSNGMLVFPALVAAQWWIGIPITRTSRILAGISLLAGAVLTLSAGGENAKRLLAHLIEAPAFLCYLVGIPFHFAGVPQTACLIVGGLGLLLAGAALWSIHDRPTAQSPDRQILRGSVAQCLTAWLVFALATMLLITAGRTGASEQPPFDEKYFLYSALIWAPSLLLLALLNRWRIVVATVAIASIWILFPATQEQLLWRARWFRRSMEPLMAAVQFGTESPQIARFSGLKDPTLVGKLYRAKLNSFSYPNIRDLGWKLTDRLENIGSCKEGATEGAEQLVSGFRLNGWSDNLPFPSDDRRVLFTTVAPLPYVVGWGDFLLPRGEPTWPFRNMTPPELLTWEGYLDPRTRGSVQAWAVSFRTKEACTLGPAVVLP